MHTLFRWVLTGKGDDPRKAKMPRRKIDTPRTVKKLPLEKQIEKPAVTTQAVPPEEKKYVEGDSRAQAPQRHWDAESSGSNTDDCEHCEQLKRAVPPSDTKRVSVTTVKRTKTSGHHHEPTKQPTQRSTRSHSPDHWEAESFESNTRESHPRTKASVHFHSRGLNHVSLAATKQILNNFVTSSVLSTPPSRFTRRPSGKVEPKLQAGAKLVRRNHDGPLHNFTLGNQGRKSKAG